MANFAIIGIGGYIAQRHIKAIQDTGSNLLASYDINEPDKKLLNSLSKNHKFYNKIEDFKSFISSSKKNNQKINFIVICSPNHHHLEHILLSHRLGCDVICEKPLVGNISDLHKIRESEIRYSKTTFSILQLRYHSAILKIKQKLLIDSPHPKKGELTYVTSRDKNYMSTWKGDQSKSFGIEANIGIHFFDLLCHLFGEVNENIIFEYQPTFSCGRLHFKKISIDWFLSIEKDHLPSKSNETTFRSLKIGNHEVDFSSLKGFSDLHSISYEEILSGNGFGLDVVEAGIKILSDIKSSAVIEHDKDAHYLLKKI